MIADRISSPLLAETFIHWKERDGQNRSEMSHIFEWHFVSQFPSRKFCCCLLVVSLLYITQDFWLGGDCYQTLKI
jgi:hypothetical protein